MRYSDSQTIESILEQLTPEEKVALCHANSLFTSAGVPRLELDELSMSDGPHGVRESFERHSWKFLNREEERCTYLPTATALAATWNPVLAYRFGETLGAEARYRGKDIILGPGVNIIRTPLCGRNFEYFSEDPHLTGEMAKEVVKGVQSQDVAACVKHFILNNQELDRSGVDIEVGKRALHEIYLKAFYTAIMEGGAYTVMGAYNRYRGQYCCHNAYLKKLLKDEWGFDGVYISDWSGTHDTEEAIFNGLDIEMGSSRCLSDAFLHRAEESEEVRQCLDDKARRVLRLMLRLGKLDPERKTGAYNTPDHQKTAYDIAAEAMVLLKNDDGLLPIKKEELKHILVIGPNANKVHAQGGNSSGVKALYEVTPLEGLRNRLGGQCEITYETGEVETPWPVIPVDCLSIVDRGSGCRGVRQIAINLREDKTLSRMTTFSNNGAIEQGLAAEYEVSATVSIPTTGKYSFRFASNSWMTIHINEEMVAEKTDGEIIIQKNYEAGNEVNLSIRVVRKNTEIDFMMGWQSPDRKVRHTTETELLEKASCADYVIYCGGLDHSFDCESFDRRSMALPSEQDVLIPKLLKANPKTIIVMTAGSPVAMPWVEQAKAILWTWYGGMEVGNVLADVLLGRVCPSGKLPFTMPYVYDDTPVARYGEYQAGKCRYHEGILVGYRGYEYDHLAPMFPFGHGLSYSQFTYSDIRIETVGTNRKVFFYLTNAGTTPAKETVQVYIGDPACGVIRPPKELCAFEKVALEPGECREVSVLISEQAMSYYDEANENWHLEPGEFIVYVGSSSQDIRLTGSFFVGPQ